MIGDTTIKDFNRKEPVDLKLKQACQNIAERIAHRAVVKEMEQLCKTMVANNDYDINHYRTESTSGCDAEKGSFWIDLKVVYKGK